MMAVKALLIECKPNHHIPERIVVDIARKVADQDKVGRDNSILFLSAERERLFCLLDGDFRPPIRRGFDVDVLPLGLLHLDSDQ